MTTKKEASPAVSFLRAMYENNKGGFVELRAIPTSKSADTKERRRFATTPGEINDFVEKYGFRGSPWGVYFGIGKRLEESNGKKGNVGALTCLWADVDTVKNGWDTDTVARTIHALPKPLKPNVCVNSGGGLHLYWMLNEPTADHERVEELNKKIALLFGGDNIHDVSRILRLPGSFNNKRKPTICEVMWSYHWDRYTLDAVSGAVATRGDTVFTGEKFEGRKERAAVSVEFDPAEAYVRALSAGNRNVARDIDRYWEDNVRHGAPHGYVGVHEAQLVTTARMHCSGFGANNVKAVVDRVLRLTKKRVSIDAPELLGTWDWDEEASTIRKMFIDFFPKWQEMKKAYRAERRTAKAAAHD